MSYMLNNEQKLNDVIFADRNKEYGAYALRSDYGHTVFKSLSFMLIGVGSVMTVAFFMSNKNNPGPDVAETVFVQDTFIVIPFNPDDKPDDPRPDKPDKPNPPTDDTPPSDQSSTTIVDSTFESSQTSTTSLVTLPTNTAPSNDPGGPIVSGNSGKSAGSGLGTDTSEINQLFGVDSPPEFEGGLSALYRFVGQHLKYPSWASEEGKEGTVYVKFVVDEMGKVGSLSLFNSVGYGMDDEALRVVSLIPKFKSPAKKKGTPVKVYYQIPIRFRFKY